MYVCMYVCMSTTRQLILVSFYPLQIPRWDLDRFHMTSKQIGSSMKSVGEVRIPHRRNYFQFLIKRVSFHGFGDIENYLLQKFTHWQVTFYILTL